MLTPANYICTYKRVFNGQISLCFHVFLLPVAPEDDWTLTDVLASFRLNLCPVPLLSWIHSHRTHFCWALEVWSQFFCASFLCKRSSFLPSISCCESNVCDGCTMVRSVGLGQTRIQSLSLQFWNKTTSFEVIEWILCVMRVRCFRCTSRSLRRYSSSSRSKANAVIHKQWAAASNISSSLLEQRSWFIQYNNL